MSEAQHPDYTFRIPDLGENIQQHTQHGMRNPDGTVVWGEMRYTFRNGNTRLVQFHRLDPSSEQHSSGCAMDWQTVLADRAKAANMDVDEYAAQHQLVKRTVILVATASEDVK